VIAVAAGPGIVLVFLLLGLAVPFVVWALSKRERIGDRGVDRSDAERWARRDDEEDRKRDRDRR
jgi:hypothetical protein